MRKQANMTESAITITKRCGLPGQKILGLSGKN